MATPPKTPPNARVIKTEKSASLPPVSSGAPMPKIKPEKQPAVKPAEPKK